MGASSSVPSNLSHEGLYQRTGDSRFMINHIFNFMLHELRVNDFLQLSSPEGCRRYVLFMANNLHKFFHQMKLDITRDNQGILAFREAEELEEPKGEAGKQKQSLCTLLAYYYTRIFQIYGALALTLIDDISYAIQTSDMSVTENLHAPGHAFVRVPIKRQIVGGALPDFQNFNVLKSYLVDTKQKEGYVTHYRGTKPAEGDVFFQTEHQMVDAMGRPRVSDAFTKEQKGVFTLHPKGAVAYAYLHVMAQKETREAPRTVFSIRSLRYRKKGESSDSTLWSFPEEAIGELPKTIVIVGDTIEGSPLSFHEYISRLLERLILYVTGSYKKRQEDGISDDGVIGPLQLSKLDYALRNQPLGHCIARAMQLLNMDPAGKDAEGKAFTSSICKAAFFVSPDGTKHSRRGMPVGGKDLSETPGLLAMSQLFYDTVVTGSPSLVMGKESFEQYRVFMKRMAGLFMGKEAATNLVVTDKTHLDSIKDIRNSVQQGICKDYSDKVIPLTTETAQSIKQVVYSLYRRQLEHAEQCGSIFKMMFVIKKEGKEPEVQLSENIMQGGIPEINRINRLAREVLIQYYSDCESKYYEGIGTILRSKPTVPVAPVPTVPKAPLAPVEKTLLAQQAAAAALKAASRMVVEPPTIEQREQVARNQARPAISAKQTQQNEKSRIATLSTSLRSKLPSQVYKILWPQIKPDQVQPLLDYLTQHPDATPVNIHAFKDTIHTRYRGGTRKHIRK